jgi:hypothetical protein
MARTPKAQAHSHHQGHRNSSHPPMQTDQAADIVAEAEARDPGPERGLTPKVRRSVAKVVAADRMLKKIPPMMHRTPAEQKAHKQHVRDMHVHRAEVAESLGTNARATLAQAQRELPAGVNVETLVEQLRSMKPHFAHLGAPPRGRRIPRE